MTANPVSQLSARMLVLVGAALALATYLVPEALRPFVLLGGLLLWLAGVVLQLAMMMPKLLRRRNVR